MKKLMKYNEILKMVIKQNPKKTYKDCQKLASSYLASQKEGEQDLKGEETKVEKGKVKLSEAELSTALTPACYEAEKAIREAGVNRNNIVSYGRAVLSGGELKIHGKAENGVNKNVSFEDEVGNKIPVEGYFQIFI